MHTPEQARTLWCPMARLDGVNGSYNRETAASHRHPTCVASECAMWRWEHTTASVPAEHGTGDNKFVTHEQKTVKTHGYCGLSPLHQ